MHGQNGLLVQLLCGRSFTRLSVCEDNMNLTFAGSPVRLPSEEMWGLQHSSPAVTVTHKQTNIHISSRESTAGNTQSLWFHIAALRFDMPGLLCIFDKWLWPCEVFFNLLSQKHEGLGGAAFDYRPAARREHVWSPQAASATTPTLCKSKC